MCKLYRYTCIVQCSLKKGIRSVPRYLKKRNRSFIVPFENERAPFLVPNKMKILN